MTRALLLFIAIACTAMATPPIRVGSKPFTESNILAEILAQTIEGMQGMQGMQGVQVSRKYNLGATGIIFRSLQEGEIDVYPEYTGTISQAILKLPREGASSWEELQRSLQSMGLQMSRPLGFNNTYALSVRQEVADQYQLQRISDLARVPHLKAAFDPEFTNRKDGLKALQEAYGLRFPRQLVMEHALLYQAVANGDVDVIDNYSTDPKIPILKLRVLRDDREFFPAYLAVLLTTRKFVREHPQLWNALDGSLAGTISEDTIIRLNGEVEVDKLTYASVATGYLRQKSTKVSQHSQYWERIGYYIVQHLQLVLIPLLGSIVFGVALGALGAWYRMSAQLILSSMGLLQTIPSLALLCLLIPLFGIGRSTAYFAIFLYGILPITRNTYLGLTSVRKDLLDYSLSIGLNRWELLKLLQLPLAMKSILTGIKTSAIINVGTATLAAFIGGGGLGTIIVAGLTLNDQNLILLGALPASLLALLMHFALELLDRLFIPKGLR